MENQILSEYLEKYAGGEYVYFISRMKDSGIYGYIVICKILEKAKYKYYNDTYDFYLNNLTFKRCGYEKFIVTYKDGTEKDLGYICELGTKDIINDKDEIEKLPKFLCSGLMIVDILGIDKERMKLFEKGESYSHMGPGEIIDEYEMVFPIENFITHVNNGMDEYQLRNKIVKCLLEK